MVNLVDCSIEEFYSHIKGKALICFGSGAILDLLCNQYIGIIEHIDYIIDNNELKAGKTKEIGNRVFQVTSYSKFIKLFPCKDMAILITTSLEFAVEIKRQLDNEILFDGMDCYVGVIFEKYRSKVQDLVLTKGDKQKIPKHIHYCWFGSNPIPPHLEACIVSWQKYCPDYVITRWDERNYDISKNLYMKQAYEEKKWAFVPDYARLDIIYNYGGVYFDTDVELLKSIDDLLYDEMFCGFESHDFIALGLGFGAIRHHFFIEKLLDKYNDIKFINDDGTLNMIGSPIYQTEVFREYGFNIDNTQQKKDGIMIYPCEVLCPITTVGMDCFTENTYSIHHYDASWVEKKHIEHWKKEGDLIKQLMMM